MKKLAFLLAAGAAFGAGPLAARLGPLAGSLAFVVLGVALALAASGTPSSLGAAGGALGAFAGGMLAPFSAAAAGAALAALCFAERTARVRAPRARLLHAAATLGAGAIAGSLTAGFVSAAPALRGVSVVVAAVLVGLPLLIDTDHPVAHTLDGLSAELPEPSRTALREAAALRRAVGEALLDRRAAAQVSRTWASLVRLAEARILVGRTAPALVTGGAVTGPGAAARAVVARLDARIGEHVAGLTRAYTAVDAARAAEVSLDDAALRGVETVGESFEEVSQAIVDQG